jgi:hypothetical protein
MIFAHDGPSAIRFTLLKFATARVDFLGSLEIESSATDS